MVIKQKAQAYKIHLHNHTSKDNDWQTVHIKRRGITTIRQLLQEKFPKTKVMIVMIDNPSSIHGFSRFEKKSQV